MFELNLNNTVLVLNQAIDQQIQIYQEVVNISIEQQKAVDENNEIKLMEYIDAKNDLMAKANQINNNAQAFREYWDNNLDSISFEIKDQMKTKVMKLSDLIKEVLMNEEKMCTGILKLQQEKDQVNMQKNNIKKLKSAYGSAPTKDQFIDKSK